MQINDGSALTLNLRTASRPGSQRVDCWTILETIVRACRFEPLRPGTGRGPAQWFMPRAS